MAEPKPIAGRVIVMIVAVWFALILILGSALDYAHSAGLLR